MGSPTKTKTYDSEEEFERDRRRMFESGGWMVVEKMVVPLVKPSWAMAGTAGGSVAAWVFMVPLMLLGKLIYRNAPDEQIVVTYARPDG